MIKKLFFITTFLIALAKSLLGTDSTLWFQPPTISDENKTIITEHDKNMATKSTTTNQQEIKPAVKLLLK